MPNNWKLRKDLSLETENQIFYESTNLNAIVNLVLREGKIEVGNIVPTKDSKFTSKKYNNILDIINIDFNLDGKIV